MKFSKYIAIVSYFGTPLMALTEDAFIIIINYC